VLATDQLTEQEQIEGKTRVKTFSTVTVEATPKIAEKIAVAQTIGTISLSLRSLADNSNELDQAIALGQIKIPAWHQQGRRGAHHQAGDVEAHRGRRQQLHATGGDVSRFQPKKIVQNDMAAAVRAMTSAAPAPAVPTGGSMTRCRQGTVSNRGPVVRVTRGHDTQEVKVGSH
jgi:pilus assembly protein CpaB